MAKRQERPKAHAPEREASATQRPFIDRIAALQREATAKLDDAARGYFNALVTPEKAVRVGAQYESGAVVDAFLGVAHAVSAELASGALAAHGYGPLRMAAALEVARMLAEEIAAIDAALVTAAGAAGNADVSLRSAATVRARALAVLRNTTATQDADGQRRVREARRADRSANDRARSLASIADEVERRVHALPAAVAKDSGATADLVAALRAHVAALDAARATRIDARGAALSRYEGMDLLDGRLVHELRAIHAAWRALRNERPGLPKLRTPLLRNGRRAQATKPAPAPDPAKPAS